MRKSSLCDYSDAYLLVKGRTTITWADGDATANQEEEQNKGVIFKNCASFINCKSEINKIGIDNAKDIDIVVPLYNMVEYSDNYSKTSGSLWQCYKNKPNNNVINFESFKSKIKITGDNPANGNTKDVEIMVPLI